MSYLEQAAERVQAALTEALDRVATRIDGDGEGHLAPPKLLDAMRYAVFTPGKRLRPGLVLAGARAVGGAEADALPAACAVEMIHAYSLVHDDLPCMDDDAERRGQPSCHVKFGEATALLAGDALLTEAFAVLADPRPLAGGAPLSAEVRAEAVRRLARAAGTAGMVGGQLDDVEAEVAGETAALPRERLLAIHRRKTGRLIQASAALGALCGGGGPTDVERLRAYGEDVGLAFQLVDDILDGDGLARTDGDAATRAEARRLTGRALEAVAPYGERARPLVDLAEQMAARVA